MSNETIHKERPLSPHLSIYKPQITSVLSILHRMTGAYIFLGLCAICWWFIFAIYSEFNPELTNWTFFTENIIGKVLLLSWAVSLYYHFFNGIRHLAWDAGWGFELKTVSWSGILVLVLSLAMTLITAYFAFQI